MNDFNHAMRPPFELEVLRNIVEDSAMRACGDEIRGIWPFATLNDDLGPDDEITDIVGGELDEEMHL